MPHLSHMYACSCIACYTSCVCHTGMNILAYIVTHICKQSHIPPHRLYLPHRHECTRRFCHTSMHIVALCYARCTCYIGMCAVVLSAPQACMMLQYVPHMHAYHSICKCMICHKGTHVAAQCTTQARMRWHNPPQVHASMGTSFTHPIRYSRDARALNPHFLTETARLV